MLAVNIVKRYWLLFKSGSPLPLILLSSEERFATLNRVLGCRWGRGGGLLFSSLRWSCNKRTINNSYRNCLHFNLDSVDCRTWLMCQSQAYARAAGENIKWKKKHCKVNMVSKSKYVKMLQIYHHYMSEHPITVLISVSHRLSQDGAHTP